MRKRVGVKKTSKFKKNIELYRKNGIDESIDQVSAGGVVYRKCKDNKIRVVLIRDQNTHKWILPKGRNELGESLEDTSHREVKEETGLQNIKLIQKIDKTNYWFKTKNQKKLTKEVHFFLYEDVNDKDNISVEKGNFDKGQWFTKEESLRIISFPSQKKILQKAFKLIENEGS
ncbi:MAG: NUDIX hydrolase [Candidatus Heimdallarchaeota archaeon]